MIDLVAGLNFTVVFFLLLFVYSLSHVWLWPHGLQPSRLLCPCDFPGKSTGVCCCSFLHGIFLTQGLNSCHCTAGEDNGTPVLLPGKSHGWRSLVGCSPWGREESDTTERLHFHFSLSCIGEANGNPLQCSCLENPRDGGAWWAAVCGVAQSQIGLVWLSSSSSVALEVYSLLLSHREAPFCY